MDSNRIILKSDEEIEFMRDANRLVGMTLGELSHHIRPGITTLQLDRIAETFIRDHGAIPTFLGYGGFPNSICTSVNENVVHGIPNDKPLEEGDVISVDCGTNLRGFCGDSAYTFCVGEVKEEVKQLLRITREALYKGIEQAREDNRIGDIGSAIQSYCESHGYGVVRELWVMELVSRCTRLPRYPTMGVAVPVRSCGTACALPSSR